MSASLAEIQAWSGETRTKPANRFVVALMDDEPSAHETFKEILGGQAGDWELASYSDGVQALQMILLSRPNVVLMNIGRPGVSGIECAHRIKMALPDLPVIMLADRMDEPSVLYSMQAGADGYMVKPVSVERLVAALRVVLHGGLALCCEARAVLMKSEPQQGCRKHFDALTEREKEITALLAEDLPGKQLAGRLNISINTLSVHLDRIYKKLGVHNRKGAVRKLRNDIVRIDRTRSVK